MIVRDFPQHQLEWINRTNIFSYSPLMVSCFRGYMNKSQARDAAEQRLEIVRYLIQNRADVSKGAEDTSMGCIHWAAYNEDPDVVHDLLQYGADIFQISISNRLPIDVAGSCKAYEVVDVFLDHFYKVMISGEQSPRRPQGASFSNSGRTPLEISSLSLKPKE